MTDPDVAALAGRAIAIAEQAAETQGRIVAQQGRSKRTVRFLIVSVAFDIALSVTLVFLAANQASVSHQIHSSQVAACAIGNQFRAGQVQLWDHVIAVSTPPPGETAARRAARLKTLAGFRRYVAAHFSPVDCRRLYR